MKYSVTQTRLAQQHLTDHAVYIARQGQPAAATRLIDLYHDICERLADYPESGHLYDSSDVQFQNIRVLPFKGYPYLLYYRWQNQQVITLAILHGGMSPQLMRSMLKRT